MLHDSLITRFSHRSDLHQSPMYAQVMQDLLWHSEGKPGSRIFFRQLGPVCLAKLQRPKELDLPWLKTFRQTHHTLLTYIEPSLALPLAPGLPSDPFAHSCTSLLDLSLSEASLLASFSQKTRYNIHYALKNQALTLTSRPLNILSDNELANFFTLYANWNHAKKHVGHSPSFIRSVIAHFSDHGTLHLASHQTNLVAALLVLYHDSVATYYTAASTQAGQHHFAPTLLTWVAMATAKEQGCDIFDFGGIFDPRYPRLYKNWVGFTKFKSGFHPTVISYPPTTLQLFW